MPTSYPGTAQHQTLLNCIVNHYQEDDRVLAVCLFGSLARGNWDEYSDLDLDIIVADGAEIDILPELNNLCAAFQPFGEQTQIVIPKDLDAGDIVLQSLMELSVRYHVLACAV
jgi:predicted nucleotidyltransferase